VNIVMTTLFGIESLAVDELIDLGYERSQMTVTDGQIVLDAGSGAALAAARLNIQLRTVERVLVQLAQFEAVDFDSLFDQTRSEPWEEWLDRGVAFHINGYSRKSALFGIPACQSIIKKAIISRLAEQMGLAPGSHVPEDQALGLIRIQFSIVSDVVTLMVDTSGDGLHKRGYRPLRNEAPLKETLAAALVKLSQFRPNSPEALLDPFCGSGTIPIEAALLAFHIAPGLNRTFAGEQWSLIGPEAFAAARQEALDQMIREKPAKVFIFGSDLSPQAVALAEQNARRAGVDGLIRFRSQDIRTLSLPKLGEWTRFDRHLLICNPPYGERLLDTEAANALYRAIGLLCLPNGELEPGVRLSVISPEDQFEQIIQARADKRRKLYNGMIRCTMYHYFRQRSR
jgi:putative N6-adenine-specific DNA methylase